MATAGLNPQTPGASDYASCPAVARALHMHPLDRYRPLIDDWPAFLDALDRPLPTCVWTNTLRTTPEALQGWLADAGFAATPLSGLPGAFQLDGDAEGPGRTLPFVGGLCHVQEAVSMLPVPLLDPQPHERILDACAAPGNKTAQIGVALRGTGTVVANDRNALRLKGLRATIDRLGLANVTATVHDAAYYPDHAGRFDRVLADVPCSCEGTSRKHPRALLGAGPEQSGRLHPVQVSILQRAVDVCAPGGRIVYATCTYAPEENEAVVDAVLASSNGAVRILPATIAGFQTEPGVTAWDGRTFDRSLRHAHRLWPHHNDTGGFFIAVLQKAADT